MSTAEKIKDGIKSDDEGVVCTGLGITLYRFLQLKSSMKMELDSGLKVGKGIKPFNIAAEELGIEADIDEEDRVLNKAEVYKAVCELTNEQAVERLEAYAAKKAAEPKVERQPRGTRDDNETIEVLDGLFEVPIENVVNLIDCALSGGSNYWYFIASSKEPSDESMVPKCCADYRYLSCFWGDGETTFCDIEEYYGNDESIKGIETFVLNEEVIRKGLEACFKSKEFRNLFGRWMFAHEDCDGDLGDIFLQHCLFGKMVYG